MLYDVIVSDPPWAFSDGLKKMKAKTKRSARSQYNTMSSTEIAALDVKSIANPEGCVLALWVPGTLLPDGLMVMQAWDFSYKQIAVWVKTKKDINKHLKKVQKDNKIVDLNDFMSFGMGRLFRQSHEIALIGTMGKVYSQLENKSQRSVMFDVNKGHSSKPELLQDRLDLMFPNAQRLEMFARRTRPNWTCIGNAIDGKDIGQAIQDLML
mgnify:CR=1 FL=1